MQTTEIDDQTLPSAVTSPPAPTCPTADVLLITIGCAVTLALGGYQFGQSNHTVYLLDALRRANPEVLANDWFTTQTLQYHALFGFMTRSLFNLRIVEPVFLVGYLAIIALLHLAWYRITQVLGGDRLSYLASVIFVYLSANATALGMYQFLQDSAFLPSNVASVALLWAVYGRMAGQRSTAASGLAVAGAFHLNYAVVGVGLWVALDLLEWWNTRSTRSHTGRPWRAMLITLLALGPAITSIAFALWAMADDRPRMPLDQFVATYVRLRHPHHYDPSSWPVSLWIAFLWPVPLAVWVYWQNRRDAPWRVGGWIFALVALLAIVSLVGAGVWYVSERLVQLSLMRFTVYLQLLACIAVAVPITRTKSQLATALPIVFAVVMVALALIPGSERLLFGPDAAHILFRPSALLFCAALILLAVVQHWVGFRFAQFALAAGIVAGLWVGWERNQLGLTPMGRDGEMENLAAYIREHTHVNDVFLVPPDDQSFRLYAQRATIVNFKGVPQLSSELPEWRQRMQNVLAMDDLNTLPRPFLRTLRAIRQRYHELTANQLLGIAQHYDARYLISTKPLQHPRLALQKTSAGGVYFLYKCTDG